MHCSAHKLLIECGEQSLIPEQTETQKTKQISEDTAVSITLTLMLHTGDFDLPQKAQKTLVLVPSTQHKVFIL